jgi:hypothetical protein
MTGEAAWLSGTKEKQRAKDSTGGLLRELGDRGCLIYLDFTTVLSKPKDEIKSTFGILRRVYDGSWDREIGGEGGRRLAWTGRIGFLGATTDAIYAHLTTEMGERCIYFRYGKTDGYQETRRALQNGDPEEIDYGLQSALLDFAFELDFSWSDTTPTEPLDEYETNKLISIAQFSSRARAGTVRDYRTRELIGINQPEDPMRIGRQLMQMYRGMKRIGVDVDDRWQVVSKIGMDCMPQGRIECFTAIMGRKGEATTAEVAGDMRVSYIGAKRAVEDLQAHGLLEARDKNEWKMTEWTKERLKLGWGLNGFHK